MGNLAGMSKPQNPVDGFIGSIAQIISYEVTRQLEKSLQAANQSQVATQMTVANMLPAIQRALGEAVNALVPKLDQMMNELRSGAITQQDLVRLQNSLVKALSNVKIPDYSEALARIEAKETDLTAVIAKLEAMESEEEPDVWHFKVERNANGFITGVTAREGDE